MDEPLRVLYALWHYPQLSESYVRAEIRAVTKLGVAVEVWAQERPLATYTSDVPHHEGSIEQAVARFRPHVIHTHWLRQPKRMKELRGLGLPITARGHSFDSSRKKVVRTVRDPLLAAAFPFPHFIPRRPWLRRKVVGVPAAFDPALYSPGERKDRRLVARVGTALPGKDYETFLEVARRCPEHRFVLALCPAHKAEHWVGEFIAMNRALGEPVEIRVGIQHEEVAALLREAAIYLHTFSPDETFGMPISIAEAMASGCYLLARDLSVARSYLAEAGNTYRSADEAAALVAATLAWDEARWQAAGKRSADRAFSNFEGTRVLVPMVERWKEIAAAS